jgi:hypothetical protein
MAIINAQLRTTDVNILDPDGNVAAPYTGGVPEGKSYAITNILVCNTSLSDAASFDMHLVPYGETLDNDVTLVVRNLELPPGETFTFDSERIVLEAGDKIVFVAEPDNGGGSGLTDLAATVSYLEV